MEKVKQIYFLFLFLSAVFKRQQPSVASVESLDYRQTSVQSFISSFVNCSRLAAKQMIRRDQFHPDHRQVLQTPNGLVRGGLY